MKSRIICLFLFGGFFLPCWSADTFKTKERQLDKLRMGIEKIQSNLVTSKKNQQNTLERIQNLDLKIKKLAVDISQLKQKKQCRQQRIEQIKQEKKSLVESVLSKKHQLSQLFQSEYLNHIQTRIPVLSTPEESQKQAKNRHFHQYFITQRATELLTWEKISKKYRKLVQESQKQIQFDQLLQQTLSQKQAALRRLKQKKVHQLSNIQHKISKNSTQLHTLIENEHALVSLIKSLQKTLRDVSEDLSQHQTFQLTQTLSWPVSGKVVHRFGDPRQLTVWDGILLEIDKGSTIQAIFRGQVIYAEPLRGLGLLLILDHGDGYMSLYGHHKTLNKSVGDWVEQGETLGIADILYFGLRVNGKPVDPLNWLNR